MLSSNDESVNRDSKEDLDEVGSEPSSDPKEEGFAQFLSDGKENPKGLRKSIGI